MQVLIKKGRRWFAVPKVSTLTDRIACRTQCKGNWDKILTTHATARVVLNYHKR